MMVFSAAILAAILNFAKVKKLARTFELKMINRQTKPFLALILLKEFIGMLSIITRGSYWSDIGDLIKKQS